MEKVIKALNVEEVRLLRNENERLRAEVEKLRRVRDAAEACLNWSQGEPGDIAAIYEALRAALDAAKDGGE